MFCVVEVLRLGRGGTRWRTSLACLLCWKLTLLLCVAFWRVTLVIFYFLLVCVRSTVEAHAVNVSGVLHS